MPKLDKTPSQKKPVESADLSKAKSFVYLAADDSGKPVYPLPERPTAAMLRLIDCLMDSTPEETKGQIFARANVPYRTAYRYAKNPVFVAALQERMDQRFKLVRPRVQGALFRKSILGSAIHQRLFFQLTGDLREATTTNINVQNQNQEQQQIQEQMDDIRKEIDQLPVELKKLMAEVLDPEVSEEKKDRIKVGLRELLKG